MNRGVRGGLGRGVGTGDAWASRKRSESATGSPLTLSGDNMWPIICAFHCAGEKRPKG